MKLALSNLSWTLARPDYPNTELVRWGYWWLAGMATPWYYLSRTESNLPMTDKNKTRKPRGKLDSERADRLAAEMRANLKKRKALMRSRTQAEREARPEDQEIED